MRKIRVEMSTFRRETVSASKFTNFDMIFTQIEIEFRRKT